MKSYKERLAEIYQNLQIDRWVRALLDLAIEVIEKNEQLTNELAAIKKQPTRPKITPSRLEEKKHKSTKPECTWVKSSKTNDFVVDRTETITLPPDQIPQGAKFKGYKSYFVQELIITKEVVCYKLAQWQKPDGTYIFAKLPAELEGQHFGLTLRKYIIQQHHINRVPQGRIKDDLRDKGIKISTGQINAILEEAAKALKREKDDLLDAGLKSGHIQTDDTGARHQGKNGVATVICNDFFTYIKSTNSKSRINFLEILCGEKVEYTITNEALDYIKKYIKTELTINKVQELLGNSPKNKVEWASFLKEQLFGKTTCRVLTEGALIGSLVAREILTPETILMSDGAGQFDLFQHALCWVHVERAIKNLVPINEKDRLEQATILDKFWAFYNTLKVYKQAPTEEQKTKLIILFDEIFSFRASEIPLAKVLKKIRDQKAKLLLVLEHPSIPLHNNTSERDIREYVIRRKISGGTRSDVGREARDTFTSLYKTCKKLGIQFWQFLDDRLRGTNQIPSLAQLVRKKIAGAASGP